MILKLMLTNLPIIAPAAESCAPNERAKDQETSLLLYDVRLAKTRRGQFLISFPCRDWSHVYYKRYIRRSSSTNLA